MKLKDGWVLLAYSAEGDEWELSNQEEREATVVYTTEYRLMFSYSEEGNIGEMEKEIVPKDGRNAKRMRKGM